LIFSHAFDRPDLTVRRIQQGYEAMAANEIFALANESTMRWHPPQVLASASIANLFV
jgi:hypothetical protein